MTLEQRLDEATKGLVQPAREKVAREVAGRDVTALGDPKAANARYEKRFVTELELEGQRAYTRSLRWMKWFAAALVAFSLLSDFIFWHDRPQRLVPLMLASLVVASFWAAWWLWVRRGPPPTAAWVWTQSLLFVAISFNSLRDTLADVIGGRPVDGVSWGFTAVTFGLMLGILVYLGLALRRARLSYS